MYILILYNNVNYQKIETGEGYATIGSRKVVAKNKFIFLASNA